MARHGRISRDLEDVRFHYVHGSEPQDAHFLAGVPEPSLSDHKPSWNLGLDWQVNPQTLLYITQRGSFRAGGFNGTSTIPEAPGSSHTSPAGVAIDSFKPEISGIWSSELNSLAGLGAADAHQRRCV